jgi:putative sugar O-methyltransferase
LQINEKDLINFRSNILSQTLDPGNKYSIDEEKECKQVSLFFDFFVKSKNNLHVFTESGIGNPYITKIKGIEVNRSSIINGFFYNLIKQKCKNCQVIVEIGGGYGGLAGLFNKNHMVDYYIYDLPEALLMQTYFLSNLVPNKYFNLVDNYHKKQTSDCIHLLTPDFIRDLNNSSVDAFINMFGMQEMDIETVNFYLSEADRVLKDQGILVLANRMKKSTKISDYKIPNTFDLVEFSLLDVHIFPKLTFLIILRKKLHQPKNITVTNILSQFKEESSLSLLFAPIRYYFKIIINKFFS